MHSAPSLQSCTATRCLSFSPAALRKHHSIIAAPLPWSCSARGAASSQKLREPVGIGLHEDKSQSANEQRSESVCWQAGVQKAWLSYACKLLPAQDGVDASLPSKQVPTCYTSRTRVIKQHTTRLHEHDPNLLKVAARVAGIYELLQVPPLSLLPGMSKGTLRPVVGTSSRANLHLSVKFCKLGSGWSASSANSSAGIVAP